MVLSHGEIVKRIDELMVENKYLFAIRDSRKINAILKELSDEIRGE